MVRHHSHLVSLTIHMQRNQFAHVRLLRVQQIKTLPSVQQSTVHYVEQFVLSQEQYTWPERSMSRLRMLPGEKRRAFLNIAITSFGLSACCDSLKDII